MADSEPLPALSIGVSVGGTGSDARRWGDSVMRLSSRVKALRAEAKTPLAVNVVFHVPGEVVPVDFSGVRTGPFSGRDALLMVQVGLPESFPPNAEDLLIDNLREAIEVAEGFARARGLTDESGLPAVSSIVDSL